MTTKETKKRKIAAVLPGTPTSSIAISMKAPTSLQNCGEVEGTIAVRFTLVASCSLNVGNPTRFYPEVANRRRRSRVIVCKPQIKVSRADLVRELYIG